MIVTLSWCLGIWFYNYKSLKKFENNKKIYVIIREISTNWNEKTTYPPLRLWLWNPSKDLQWESWQFGIGTESWPATCIHCFPPSGSRRTGSENKSWFSVFWNRTKSGISKVYRDMIKSFTWAYMSYIFKRKYWRDILKFVKFIYHE